MATTQKSDGLSADEKAAIRDSAKELQARANGSDGEADVLAKIDQMPDGDRTLARSFHQLVQTVAPDLISRTWYGMPAYATPGRDGTVVCFFQSAAKMKTRYNTIGFSDSALLDEGSMWPTSFALLTWNATNEKHLIALLKTAVG